MRLREDTMLVPTVPYLLVATAARGLDMAASRPAAPVLCPAAPHPVAGRVSCRRWKRYITVTSAMVMTPETNKAHARAAHVSMRDADTNVLLYATPDSTRTGT